MKKRPIIALLTDFGNKDGFVGTVKGVIKSINPEAEIIDISHEIDSFDILEASLVLNASYKYFPQKTIFVCVVDPGVGTERKSIIVETEKYIFVSPDNGLLSLPLKKERIQKIIEITNNKYQLSRDNETFHGRDIYYFSFRIYRFN
ncbi:MAG: SAM-dependent chlorinase/fluorinase, partial [Aquificae bacterium]|nr:SAM-dependent chlorinase/fluorinase [Aquificota bacterium]